MKFNFILMAVILFSDGYLFQALLRLRHRFSKKTWRAIVILFWAFPIILMSLRWLDYWYLEMLFDKQQSQLIKRIIFFVYTAKFWGAMVLLLEDIFRFPLSLLLLLFKKPVPEKRPRGKLIPRSEFISQTALVVGAAPMLAWTYGILRGAHDYQVKEIKLPISKLPSAFKGLKIAQISDLHVGSFFNRRAVEGGIEMILDQKPDLVFFTGDLVNYDSSEIEAYFSLLQKIKAPLGVYSVLGNHDYGEYRRWKNPKDKTHNLAQMLHAHKALGWNLLVDAHQYLELDGEKIAILGVGNWGIRGRSSKYGKLEKAYAGSAEAPVKLLLSHDPSHWRAHIWNYPDIQATFSGHTHGMQMGLEYGPIRWSPVQYIYEHWAGLYQEKSQLLYVNRGFGYADVFPVRVGMPPEITIFELLPA